MGLRSHYSDKYHKGTPGTRWAVMRKFVIERVPGDPYLTRWRLLMTPWFGIMLHKIDGPDPDLHPHNHPWRFWVLILRGGYVENIVRRRTIDISGGIGAFAFRSGNVNKWKRGSFHRMDQGDYHKILRLDKEPTWTLVFTGKRNGDWGFLTPKGHVPWREYLGLEDVA